MQTSASKTISYNKKAFFDYQISEKFKVGIVLLGHEVKSIRQGKKSLKEGYVRIKNGEAFLENVHISPYQPSLKNYNPKRTRKLLLAKREIDYLLGKIKNGLTIVPISCFLDHNLVKMEIGLGKGKKNWDKREELKKKAIEQEVDRELKKKYNTG